MIRRFLGFAFVICLAGNSLAAVALAGDDECAALCCRSAKQNRPSVRPSRDCCYSECEQPGETQPTSPKSLPGIERIYKIDASLAVSPVNHIARQSSRLLLPPGRSLVQSGHIYLKTGTLLI